MKTKTKRRVIFAGVIVFGAALHWVSGVPFHRSPGEAFFTAYLGFLAIWLALCPFIRDER